MFYYPMYSMEKDNLMNEIHTKLFEIITGSHLYGTNTPESDKDYLGVFIPNIEYILGFRKVEEMDLSISDKTDDGKNTKDAVDKKLYEFRKYMKLAMEGNPNLIETLFINEPNIVEINDVGREILANRHLFPHKGIKQKFLGYAFSQKHKMIIKRDNYFDLKEAYTYLKRFDDKKYIMEVALLPDCPKYIKMNVDKTHNTKFVQIGDLQILPSTVIVKTLSKLKERLDKVGNREGLLLKYGFDVKFASHTIRLLLEGKELLQSGNLVFPLKEAEMLKDIKNGKWAVTKVLDLAEDIEKEFDSLVENSKLPSKPRFKEIEQLTINIIKRYI
jgi:uncharacterized protein